MTRDPIGKQKELGVQAKPVHLAFSSAPIDYNGERMDFHVKLAIDSMSKSDFFSVPIHLNRKFALQEKDSVSNSRDTN